MAEQEYDMKFKVLLLGDAGVGKTCILLRYVDNTFSEEEITTIGSDYKLKNIAINGKIICLQLWDTAGQERFRTVTSSYYRGAHAIIVVYDVSDPQSFQNLNQWLSEINRYSGEYIMKFVVGTKADLEKQVQNSDAEAWASRNGITFIEASSKTGMNIDQIFTTLASQLLAKQEEQKAAPKLNDIGEEEQKKNKCCNVL